MKKSIVVFAGLSLWSITAIALDYVALKAELDAGHPVTGAYSANHQTAANELNALNRSEAVDSVSGSQICNATDSTEFSSKTDGQKSRWLALCGVDTVDVSSGVAKNLEADIFGPGTTTRSNLLSLKTKAISRAAELGLGVVNASNVEHARTLP